jgi:solute:Na+ symporter, SSS family
MKGVGVFKYFQAGVTYMATPFISVLLLGIFWRRANYTGALVGLIGGVLIQVALAWALAGSSLHWLYVGAIAQAATLTVAAIASLFAAAPPAAQVEAFIWKPSWIRSYDEGEAPRPWWQQVKLWFAAYALGWCFIYWRFW